MPTFPFSDSTPFAKICLPFEIIVTGPGKKVLYIFTAEELMTEYFFAIPTSVTAIENGFPAGRFLKRLNFFTAFSFVASTPAPYKVSVG